MTKKTQEERFREERQLDRDVQAIIGWPGMHSFTSTPIWTSTLLQALPDAISMVRLDNVWSASHNGTVTVGGTLPIALGRLIVALKGDC